MNTILVAIGGAVGAVSRYLIGQLIMQFRSQHNLPIAMLVVNLLGALGLGTFLSFYTPKEAITDSLYLMVSLGFFGAFTTFSTFSIEAMELMQKRQWKYFWTYVLVTVLGSILLFSASLIFIK
ncbi:fluoride efflux transporter CrcB [Alkalibacillus aidingensis]|uniref:fluoride efflux transporter CrcB n=1 Tax=Alkalibacillus aidingensis TaxID=2747607 RepID=UPI001660C3A3|nr:fluoride efflux transporter CrcB [Alkalibacillus aidingensis]